MPSISQSRLLFRQEAKEKNAAAAYPFPATASRPSLRMARRQRIAGPAPSRHGRAPISDSLSLSFCERKTPLLRIHPLRVEVIHERGRTRCVG